MIHRKIDIQTIVNERLIRLTAIYYKSLSNIDIFYNSEIKSIWVVQNDNDENIVLIGDMFKNKLSDRDLLMITEYCIVNKQYNSDIADRYMVSEYNVWEVQALYIKINSIINIFDLKRINMLEQLEPNIHNIEFRLATVI